MLCLLLLLVMIPVALRSDFVKTLILNIQGVGNVEFVVPSGVTSDTLYLEGDSLVNQGSALTLTPIGQDSSFRIPATSQGTIEIRRTSGMTTTWESHSAVPVSGWQYIRPGDIAFYRLGVILAILLLLVVLRGAFRSGR